MKSTYNPSLILGYIYRDMDNKIYQYGKTMVFYGPGKKLIPELFPLPELKKGEILVKVEYTTICASDIHSYTGARKTPLPTILGHEIVGKIADLPKKTLLKDYKGTALKIGDRITWSVFSSDPGSYYARQGIPQKSDNLFKYGHEKITEKHPFSGGLAEYCCLKPNTTVIKIKDSLPPQVAAPINCSVATVAAAIGSAGGCKNKNVVISGAGMLGIMAAAMAKSQKAKQIIMTDIRVDRLNTSLKFGATHIAQFKEEDNLIVDDIRELTEGRGADLVLEMSGMNNSMELSLDLLRIGGKAVWIGAVFPQASLSIKGEQIVRNLLNIHGQHNYTPEDLYTAVEFIQSNQSRYPFIELVEKEFPLEKANEAFGYAIREKPCRVGIKI